MVTLKSAQDAHFLAQILHSSDRRAWHVRMAPEPRELCRGAHADRDRERGVCRALAGLAAYLLLVLFWAAPVSLIAMWTQPEALKTMVPALKARVWLGVAALIVRCSRSGRIGIILQAIFRTLGWSRVPFLTRTN